MMTCLNHAVEVQEGIAGNECWLKDLKLSPNQESKSDPCVKSRNRPIYQFGDIINRYRPVPEIYWYWRICSSKCAEIKTVFKVE